MRERPGEGWRGTGETTYLDHLLVITSLEEALLLTRLCPMG